MKSSDLMLGDFVTFKDCLEDGEVIVPIKIIVLGYQARGLEEEALVEIDGDKTCDVIEINDEIVGIPITPEILEKNGFERCVSSIVRTPTAAIPVCDSNQFATSDHPNLRIIDRGIWHYSLRTPVVCDTKHYDIHEIKYVHELQHALKMVGVEKQIEL